MIINIDCIGDPCPIPLIKAEKKLLKLGISDKICLETDHNCALNIVPEWARNKGFKVDVKETPYLEWKIYISREQKSDKKEEVLLK